MEFEHNVDTTNTALRDFPVRIPEPSELNDTEMKTFEWLAQMNYKRWFFPLVYDFLEKTKLESGEVLDVACGPGFLSKELLRYAPAMHVTALDNSKESLALARKNLEGANAEIVKGSVYQLPFADGSFDGLMCKDSLHHFDDPSQALKEMFRVLKKGGYLYINDMRRDMPYDVFAQYKPAFEEGPSHPMYNIAQLQYYSTRAAYTVDEVRELLKEMGLTPLYLGVPEISEKAQEVFEREDINIKQLEMGNQARYTLIVRNA